MNLSNKVVILLIYLLATACAQTDRPIADIVFRNGNIYTVNDEQPMAEAVAVRADTILFVGSDEEVKAYIADQTEVINLNGHTMTPGFIEGHGHFMGLGYSELNLNLLEVSSYQELIDMVKKAADKAAPGQWITGRGWHQSKWVPQPDGMVGGFQVHNRLSEVTPENPVYLSHASGHAGFANAKAMEIAGVLPMSKEGLQQHHVEGGEIIRDELGNPTGVFNERAMKLITDHIPESTPEKDRQALQLAIKACHEHGITSFHDAGVSREQLSLYRQAQASGELKVRLYAMLTGRDPQLLNEWYKRGPHIDSTHLLTIRSIKLNCDGALGSRGAWLLEPYTDRPGHYGHETLPMSFVSETASRGLETGFQVCSHAIGDRANREILDRYDSAFKAHPSAAQDHRFRIEHAQHLHPDDISRFGELDVIAAMQAIHMSSDRPWAIDRLGKQRIVDGAYVWQKLIESGATIVNGTDVPVEPINPIACFYASVSRKTLKGEPEGGYEPSQKMSREEALKSYTINGAYGAFEEKIKGSIEPGKLADFAVFSQDIMKVSEEELLNTEVIMTVFGGEVVFQNAELGK